MAGLGSTPELVIGIAAGAAASAALEPALEIPKQDAWASAPNRILNEGLLAQLVARGGVDLGTAHYFAHRNGIDDDQFGALVYLSQTVPGFAQALDLWRRDLIGPNDFRHTLVHAGLDQRYIDQLVKYKTNELIPPPDLAYMVVRDLVPNPFPGSGPTGPNDTAIEDIPQLKIDTLAEAARSGWDGTRFEALVGRSGLAPAPGLAAQAYFRKQITWDQYKTIISKGDLRPAYTNVVLNASRQIPTAGEAVEGRLRGWSTDKQMYDGTARHGMSQDDTDLLFKIKGRPMNQHQVFLALRRGGVYDGPIADIEPAVLKSLRESDIRPEWYNLEWAFRFTQPSVFVVRQWLRDGHDPAWAHEKLFFEGWEESDIDKFVTAYSPTGATGSGDAHVAKAQTQLWTTTHRSYIAREISDATATTALGAAGVSAAAVPAVLTLWQQERDLIRKQLSAQQIKKEWYEQVTDPATGAPLTQQQAIARLMELGYDQADAQTLLEL